MRDVSPAVPDAKRHALPKQDNGFFRLAAVRRGL
jgi:hypothetical protein